MAGKLMVSMLCTDKSIGPCPGILIRSMWFTAVVKCYCAGDGIFFRDTIDCSSLSSEKRFQLCRQC